MLEVRCRERQGFSFVRVIVWSGRQTQGVSQVAHLSAKHFMFLSGRVLMLVFVSPLTWSFLQQHIYHKVIKIRSGKGANVFFINHFLRNFSP